MRITDPNEITTFYVDYKDAWQQEQSYLSLTIGDGLIHSFEGRMGRFRVTDIWFSEDKRGVFEFGRHVFLREVSGKDGDLPGELHPEYYRD